MQRFRGIVLVGAVAMIGSLVGCSAIPTSIGGRPIIYQQGRGDAPETIGVQSGVVYKKTEGGAAATTTSSGPPGSAEVVAGRGPTSSSRTGGATAGAVPDGSNRYTQFSKFGDLYFLSGQVPADPATGKPIGSTSIDAQTRQALENLRAVLENNRMTMANVLSTTVYLSSINNLAAMDRVYESFFKGTPPARTVVEVTALPGNALIQISAVAGR